MRAALFLHVAKVEALKRLSYRADFWINALLGLVVQIAISWFIVAAIFRESGRSEIGGYSLRGTLLYYVAAGLLGRFVRSTDMEHALAQDVYEGGLTRYLLYPCPYIAMKYAQQIGALAPLVIQILLLGAWVPFVLGVPPELRLSAASVAMCAAALLVANLLHFLIVWPIQAVSFWADNVWSLMVAHRITASLLGGLMVPLAFFPDWARAAVAWTPFPSLFAFPIDTLLGRLDPLQWARQLAVAIAWCAAAALVGAAVWRRGDRQYTGVGI